MTRVTPLSLGEQLGDRRPGRVYDFSNARSARPRVAITPVAPGLSRITGPWQAGRIGHLVGVPDPRARIFTDGAVIPPEDAGYIDAECPDCDSALAVLPDQEPGVTWLVIEHSPTCPALAELAGAAP